MKKEALDLAIAEAHRSSQNHKHGAVVVQGGKVVATGHNRVTRRVPSHMYSKHAEMAAIDQYSSKTKSLIDACVYVVRINSRCGLANSAPCALCQRYMKSHGIKRVFFSTGEDSFGSMYI